MREVTGDVRVLNMVPALILLVGLVWGVCVLVAVSLCAVSSRSDEATRLLARDPRLS
jgi:hypothetical protein